MSPMQIYSHMNHRPLLSLFICEFLLQHENPGSHHLPPVRFIVDVKLYSWEAALSTRAQYLHADSFALSVIWG